ncbi:MAG: DUF2244 domain-containing protein [Rhizobiaceae bacterium]
MQDLNAADEPFFRALLTPHRSLGRTGFFILMGVLAFACLTTGMLFLVDGAWPILCFCGLNVVGVYIAFRLNYRAARVHEEVALSRTSLDIRKVAASGRAEEHRFNPFWTRFSVSRHQEIGITGMAVEARGESVPIGAFLNPDDRESFANAFSRARATAKGR